MSSKTNNVNILINTQNNGPRSSKLTSVAQKALETALSKLTPEKVLQCFDKVFKDENQKQSFLQMHQQLIQQLQENIMVCIT